MKQPFDGVLIGGIRGQPVKGFGRVGHETARQQDFRGPRHGGLTLPGSAGPYDA